MSSDESTSTQVSAISSQIGNEQKLKTHKSEQWEINLIGNFLLSLYHRLVITPQNNWMVNKSDVRKEFKSFLTAELCKKIKELNGTDNIGTLLHRCRFLLNTPRGSAFYKIKSLALFEFRNSKLKEQDNWRINNDLNPEDNNNILLNLVQKPANILLEENFEVDENETKNLLEYQGTTMQQRKENYFPTNMGCFICQEDFPTMDGYEEHMNQHNDETEFEFLKTMSKFNSPIFTMSYRLCKNSHYFCFDIETNTDNLIIEKIIIVQSRSLYYVHNARVPYSMPETRREQFFVDCHLFTIYLEQPIVLICHLKDNKETRIIEQHHFMRNVEFPKVNFAINPYRLPNKKTFKPKFTLAEYFPPKEIREALNDDFYNEKLMKVSNEFRDYVRNEKKIQPQTIGTSLNILLQIEDLDTIKQYFSLTQRNVQIRHFGDNYSIKLKPKQRIFIENVLSVCDELILTSRPDISTKPEDLMQLMLQNREDIRRMKTTFVGQIENVDSGRISFKCYQKIDLKATYTVICRPSRLNLRYQYRSLEMLPTTMPFLMKFLFPSQLIPRPLATKSLTLYNESIKDNPEQLQAVRNIAEGPRNDATYIIFGPPGTGKTTTIVEAILQVLKRDGTKILVTASSNSACDEVAIRLCKKLDQLNMSRAIVRIYSRSSETRVDTIDDDLLEHSNMYSGQFYPDIEVLHQYRIVVCTLSVVAKLSTGKFGRQESGGTLYTHLFIDEVAASMEAEALVAINTILTPKSSLIIAGDHKQLGPVLQSKRAEELGLGVSLMERLLARECYRVNSDTGGYDRTIQTRLRLNFRSHPDIVSLYSGLYYNHDLEPKVNLDDVSLVKNWHLAQNKEYPIIFHCVDAPSRCDNQSQSLYNIQELHVVMDYVKDLMYFGINGKPVKETDIGIISPYKRQYKRIQEELNLRKWFRIETGSVETFQGKEKNIIIVSFVRSCTPTLGFLENPRRLNVTISRAKSLLIMIGNPQTLSLNGDFTYVIKECQRHKTLVGSASLATGDDDDAAAKNMQYYQRFGRSTENLNVRRGDQLNNNNTRKGQNSRSQNSSNTEKLNVNRREQFNRNKNDTKNEQNPSQQRNMNAASAAVVDVTNMAAVNELMQKLDVNVNHYKEKRQRRRGGPRNRRDGAKSKNEQNSKGRNNKENNSDDDDDEADDDVSIADTLDGDNKPSTSKAAAKQQNQQQDNQSIRSREFTNAKANSGKMSKQYTKAKQNLNNKHQQQQKTKIETLFDELPLVPKITTTKEHEKSMKSPIAQVTPIMLQQQRQQERQQERQQQRQQEREQQRQQQQQFSYNPQHLPTNNNIGNRPAIPPLMSINTNFGHYNPMLPTQATGAPIMYNNAPPTHYMQQQQLRNNIGYNPPMNYPQFNSPSAPHNMASFPNNNPNVIALLQRISTIKSPSNSDQAQNLRNPLGFNPPMNYPQLNPSTAPHNMSIQNKPNVNSSLNTNQAPKSGKDIHKALADLKSANKSEDQTQDLNKIDVQKISSIVNSPSSSDQAQNSGKDIHKVLDDLKSLNKSKDVKHQCLTTTKKNLSCLKMAINTGAGRSSKKLNANKTTADINQASANYTVKSGSPNVRNRVSKVAANLQQNSIIPNNISPTVNSQSSPNSSLASSANSSNTPQIVPVVSLVKTNSTTSITSSGNSVTGTIRKSSIPSNSTLSSVPTIISTNNRQNAANVSSNTSSGTATSSQNMASTGAIRKLPTYTASHSSTPVATANVRPTIRSTSAVSTASSISSGSSTISSASNPLEPRNSRTYSMSFTNNRDDINRPIPYQSNNSYNSPQPHTSRPIYIHEEYSRPVRNLQFKEQNTAPKPKKDNCVIS